MTPTNIKPERKHKGTQITLYAAAVSHVLYKHIVKSCCFIMLKIHSIFVILTKIFERHKVCLCVCVVSAWTGLMLKDEMFKNT